MEHDIKLLQDVKRLMIARYPRFASEIANANLQFRTDLPYHTAATDGKNVYFDPNYFANLSDDDKLFTIAHELMHIKFEHMFRMTDKNGELRNMEVWNIATDAIINANLERDGFLIKEGYVNMPEALNYNSEEFYEKLLKEKEAKRQQSKNGKNQNENDNNKQQNSNSQMSDDHSFWEKAFKEHNSQNAQNNTKSAGVNGQSQENFQDGRLAKDMKEVDFGEAGFDEKTEFKQNREQRREKAKQRFEKMRNQELKKLENGNVEFGDVGEEKAKLDWKLLLKREIEKTETIWSQRRSIAENNYAYRLEENDIEDESETEVMIDVSDSVSNEMVRSFLRQLKPLLKESKLKVGFFADYATKEFQEIKRSKDIDNLKIYRPGYGTNMDSAVRAFSKKREINKIVFTDGYPGKEPKEDLKNINVIWIVYKNRQFKPCCGKVIQVSTNEVEQLSLNNDNEFNM